MKVLFSGVQHVVGLVEGFFSQDRGVSDSSLIGITVLSP